MADALQDLEQKWHRARNALRQYIHYLNATASDLNESEPLEEMAQLRTRKQCFLDASYQYGEALELTEDLTDEDDSSKRNFLTRRDATIKEHTTAAEMLWFQKVKPIIDLCVARFKTSFDQTDALSKEGMKKIILEEEEEKLDQDLDSLRDTVYAWKTYRPHGSDQWQLFLSLKRDKEALMKKWYRRTTAKNNENIDDNDESVYERATSFVQTNPSDEQGARKLNDSPPMRVSFTNLTSPDTFPQPAFTSTPRRIPAPDSFNMSQPSNAQNSREISSLNRSTIKFAPVSLPKFDGRKRGYWRWKTMWTRLEAEANPSDSPDFRTIHLLESIGESEKEKLNLKYCSDAQDIFRVLENHYGDVATIVAEILNELHAYPKIQQDRNEVLKLISVIEGSMVDLKDLGHQQTMNHPTVILSLLSKLPETKMHDWYVYEDQPINQVCDDNRMDKLFEFLTKQKKYLHSVNALVEMDMEIVGPASKKHERSRGKQVDHRMEKRSFTGATAVGSGKPCTVCGEGHEGLFRCNVFKKATLPDKKMYVKTAKACTKCLETHEFDSPCSSRFLCRKEECNKGKTPTLHHYLLCPKEPTTKNSSTKEKRSSKQALEGTPLTPTQMVESIVKQLREAFTGRTASTKQSDPDGKTDYPGLVMLATIKAERGIHLGTFIDLGSDTNYITHQAAKRLGLTGIPTSIAISGVGKTEFQTYSDTKKYRVTIQTRTSRGALKLHQMTCYGLDTICTVKQVTTPKRLQQFFPDVKLEELSRPEKIDLLIGSQEGTLAPHNLRRVGNLVLWDGPLGKIVTGTHPGLFEDVEVTTQYLKEHLVHSMTATCNTQVLEWLKWDSIGAACNPQCGGCRCGKCPPGGKNMTLADEKELEIIRAGLTFKESDVHSNQSHWDAKYPWRENPTSLPNNRKAVEATFLRTEKQLMKDQLWKEAYSRQVHDMINRGAAVKLTKDVMDNWDGAVWWVSHLIAPNPHSVTTPVRLVWNGSQEFKGISLNSILFKGPDVLNPIRAVLLRFREGMHAAIGDIKKMYNSVWLEEQEVHVHRFLWRDSPADEIKDYAVVRVNMGDKPAGCIAQVAMRETAKLPQFTDMKEERRVIEEDAYVDDLLASHNDLQCLNKILDGVERILKVGGFYLKPWVRSGQSGRKDEIKPDQVTLVLPNQLKEEDNKALGVGYLVQEDKLFVMASINFSKRKKKMRTGIDLTEEEVDTKTPNPLTRRALLSQVAGLYDPIGLVTPVKQKGVILVRKAFQEAGELTKDTWDKPLSDELREKAVELFKEYTRLNSIKFHRSLTPIGWKGKPWGITFSDGSCESYGAVLYLRWETSDGIITNLVESKAKLSPLDQKGDAVKAEICGAVFATRLKEYVLKHGRLDVERWFHFIDSQTVLGAIQRESYGFQTFFANRVGEIQKAGPVTDWWWIPGEINIADLVTRGSSPEMLNNNSVWQKGPAFLSKPVEKWPMKSAAEVAAEARETVNKLQRKAFTAVLTRAQVKKEEEQATKSPKDNEVLWGLSLVNQVDPKRYSSLTKLRGTISYARRAVRKWLVCVRKAPVPAKWEAVLTVKELELAFLDLCLAAQQGVTFPVTTLDRLVVNRDKTSGLLRCYGRVQTFTQGETGVPLLPYKAWVSTLLTREAHEVNHEGVTGTQLRVRSKAWVVQGSRIARNVIDSCMHCRKAKVKMCKQVMSDLPVERSEPASPFELTALDLFGPYIIRDTVKRRTKMKVWGIVFSCMASRAIHADIVEDLSTVGFLKTYQRFTALRGHPRKLWSDQGTNFVGARPVLKELYQFLNNIDKDKIQSKAADTGTDWTWELHPADSPHRNGAAEAAVRVLKRALSSVGEEGNLTALEFQTLLYLAANLSNERPIGARAQVRDEAIEVITPNTLLLGRAGPSGDTQGFEYPTYPVVRLRAVQIEVDKFWKRWSQLAGPSLFIRQKWHALTRNVAVGDLVWLADQNALRGRFRLGRVVEACPDKKGVVRDVKVKTCQSCPVPGSKKNQGVENYPSTILHRDIRRLVVLLPVEEQK